MRTIIGGYNTSGLSALEAACQEAAAPLLSKKDRQTCEVRIDRTAMARQLTSIYRMPVASLTLRVNLRHADIVVFYQLVLTVAVAQQ